MFTFVIRYLRVLFLAAIGTAALLIVFVVRAHAQETIPPDLTNLIEVLKWVAAGAGSVLAGVILSYASRYIAGFNALDNTIKFAIQVVLSGALGLGAWAILNYVPAETLASLAPAFSAVMLSVLAALGNQATHALFKASKKP